MELEKVVINNLKHGDLREAVVVTQEPWFMEVLNNHGIYFFSPTRIVTPMEYIVFYGTSECDPAKSISHFGKVSHIYRYVTKDDVASIPEMKGLLDDPYFSDKILSWDDYQIAVISEVVMLENPIPLTKDYKVSPRIMVNRETTIGKLLKAKKIDDLF